MKPDRQLKQKQLKQELEALYTALNQREFVSPDPLQYLYEYPSPADREIVGLIASSLAYGRVAQILKGVRQVLALLKPSPSQFVKTHSLEEMQQVFSGFRYRFDTGEHMAAMLFGAGRVIKKRGSLEQAFMEGMKQEDTTLLPALTAFCRQLRAYDNPGHLVPVSAEKSACKRMHLFLRWMVRCDGVDPGGWTGIPASKLVVPLDVHMKRIGTFLKFTERKSPDLKTALEITEGFACLMPDDPVKYDFCLTRLGIRNDISGRLFKPGSELAGLLSYLTDRH